MIRIYNTDTPSEMAYKIFTEFEVGQSCSINGLVEDGKRILSKGHMVLDEIRRMDENENVHRPKGDKRARRKRVRPENCIGGYVAQKMFRYKADDEGKVTIWRIQ